jgi:hypothetical protein
LLLQADGGNYNIVGGGGQNYVNLTNSTILSSIAFDIALTGTYVIFTNTTFDKADVAFGDATSNLTVNWFLHTRVEDSLGNPIPNAKVRIQDNANGTYDKNFTTDASGHLNWTRLTEYYQNQSTLIRYGPYNITVSRPGYFDAWAEVEMNESTSITLTLAPRPTGEMNLTQGWNLISFPLDLPKLDGTPIGRASDFFNVTNCTELAKWNATSQSYDIYIPGFHLPDEPENFIIGEDDGLFVWMSGYSTHNITGHIPGQRNVQLKSGWNMVAYKSTAVGDVEVDWAGQVECGAYDDICYYENGTFVHYIFAGTVMELTPTRGYFIWSDANTWLIY